MTEVRHHPRTRARPRLSPDTIAGIEAAVGEVVDTTVIVARTRSGRVTVLVPSDQDPRTSADLAADAAHCLMCGPGDCLC